MSHRAVGLTCRCQFHGAPVPLPLPGDVQKPTVRITKKTPAGGKGRGRAAGRGRGAAPAPASSDSERSEAGSGAGRDEAAAETAPAMAIPGPPVDHDGVDVDLSADEAPDLTVSDGVHEGPADPPPAPKFYIADRGRVLTTEGNHYVGRISYPKLGTPQEALSVYCSRHGCSYARKCAHGAITNEQIFQ